MELEWDEEKWQRNLQERGLDFADVARFEFATAITEQDLRRDYGEMRFNSWGYLDGVFCSLCWTVRNDIFRVISLRKCNDRERKKYQSATTDPAGRR